MILKKSSTLSLADIAVLIKLLKESLILSITVVMLLSIASEVCVKRYASFAFSRKIEPIPIFSGRLAGSIALI